MFCVPTLLLIQLYHKWMTKGVYSSCMHILLYMVYIQNMFNKHRWEKYWLIMFLLLFFAFLRKSDRVTGWGTVWVSEWGTRNWVTEWVSDLLILHCKHQDTHTKTPLSLPYHPHPQFSKPTIQLCKMMLEVERDDPRCDGFSMSLLMLRQCSFELCCLLLSTHTIS